MAPTSRIFPSIGDGGGRGEDALLTKAAKDLPDGFTINEANAIYEVYPYQITPRLLERYLLTAGRTERRGPGSSENFRDVIDVRIASPLKDMGLSHVGKLEVLEQLERAVLGRHAFKIENDFSLDNRAAVFAVRSREEPTMLFVAFEVGNGNFDLVARPSGRHPQRAYRVASYADMLGEMLLWADDVDSQISAKRLVAMLENGDDEDVDNFFAENPGLEFEPFTTEQQAEYESVVESWEEILASIENQTTISIDVYNRLVLELQRLRETLTTAYQGAWFRRAKKAFELVKKVAGNERVQDLVLNVGAQVAAQKLLEQINK